MPLDFEYSTKPRPAIVTIPADSMALRTYIVALSGSNCHRLLTCIALAHDITVRHYFSKFDQFLDNFSRAIILF